MKKVEFNPEKDIVFQGSQMGLLNWLQQNKDKGTPFTYPNVYQYSTVTGKLPNKIGGNAVLRQEVEFSSPMIYVLSEECDVEQAKSYLKIK